ncbi:MAG: septation protein SpoVG family protein [Candidatus Brocadiales bacterium]|nr:septation protein SpoVG family protein [Planctomycetota bacterium]MBI4007341.1 septation protein SpoVG family protein [Planctomycetota bacterium]MDO8092754.1 septation protein SpoVG family protein [Candidatus Brocadiales bacterium]
MNITEVRVRLTESRKNRLQAFCSITIDNEFVIRDLKVIEGFKGPFVAMPSRKLTSKCPRCGEKNQLRAQYCNECGNKLTVNKFVSARPGEKGAPTKTELSPSSKIKLHADTAHPINSHCREEIQNRVLAAYKEELEKSRQPGYKPPKMEELEEPDYEETEYTEEKQAKESPSG